MRSPRTRCPSHIYICADDPSATVHIIAVKTGAMIDVFPDDTESPGRRAVPFPSSRDPGGSHFISAPIQGRPLLTQSHDNRSPPLMLRRDIGRHQVSDCAAPGKRNGTNEKEEQTYSSEIHDSEVASKSRANREAALRTDRASRLRKSPLVADPRRANSECVRDSTAFDNTTPCAKMCPAYGLPCRGPGSCGNGMTAQPERETNHSIRTQRERSQLQALRLDPIKLIRRPPFQERIVEPLKFGQCGYGRRQAPPERPFSHDP
jgi:hypothetical protein